MNKTLTLSIIPGRYAVCRLDADAQIPPDVLQNPFFAVTRTRDELSILLPEEDAAPGWQAEKGWRIIKVLGPLDFSLTGILVSIAAPLAEAGISIFAISTFDTDYILVKETVLPQAAETLQASGFHIYGGK